MTPRQRPREAHTRRRFLAQLGAGAALAAIAGRVEAMGRTPHGGRLVLHVPWAVNTLDPHDVRDPGAALFGGAIADSLYGIDINGAPYPTLAASLPERDGAATIVRLREGLLSARLVPLDARDLVVSVERARVRGVAAILADIPSPRRRHGEPLAATFDTADPLRLARALASPLVALLPRRFDPASPDGTGAFRADISSSGLVLSRNLVAARGAAFLDAIEVFPADDLKTSLRAFEAERDDIGWLGLGLHGPRAGAMRFDLGRAAWIVLIVGPDAGPAGLPGAAQRLVDAIPSVPLAHLGLGPRPDAAGDPAWTGPPSELLVDAASPYLVEVAAAVAHVLSRPGHEVSLAVLPRTEIARRRAHNRASLSIELVRAVGPSPLHTLMALATAEDAVHGIEIGHTRPRIPSGADARSLTPLLRLGIIGELRVAGGVVPDVVLARSPSGEGWDLGASYRRPLKRAFL